jgi:tetratricopeptide (TPR) repeat protein
LSASLPRLFLLFTILIVAGCGPHVRLVPTDEVQTLLIQQAQEHYAEGRYGAAIGILRRLVDTYPQSPKVPEARWWLARAYEQAGQFKAALAEYRLLAEQPPSDQPRRVNYGTEARTRMAALEQRLGSLATTARGVVGVQVPPRSVPDAAAVDQWMQGLSQAGVTLLLLDAGTKPGATREPAPAGVYFNTGLAPVVRDVFGYAVPAAHRRGLAVFAAVSVRQMNWVERQLGWNDAVLDRATGRLAVSPALDLFHPAFQEYLIGLLADLAATGIDGVLFRAEASPGARDGFSSHGLRGFERDFAVTLDPATLVIPDDTTGTRLAPVRNGQNGRQEGTPDYWRWLGWKARETIKVLAHLRQAVRRRAPVLQFALELHREVVSDPLGALFRHSEDLLEAKAARFDAYVIAEGPPPAPFMIVPPPNSTPMMVRAGGTFLDRTVELLGDADDIWLVKPLPAGDPARPWAGIAPRADRASPAAGMGLVYLDCPLP